MLCPKCGAEMDFGYIPGQKDLGVFWVPDGTKMPLVISKGYVDSVDGIRIAPPSPLVPTIPKASTYVCRKCKIGLFSF